MLIKNRLSTLPRTIRCFTLVLASYAIPSLGFADVAPADKRAIAENEFRQAIEILRSSENEGIPLYQESRAPEACRLLRSAAEKGHIPAAIHLGSKYLLGTGVEQCVRTAFQYYEKAAEPVFLKMLFVPVLILTLILGAAFIVCKTTRFYSAQKTFFLLKATGAEDPKIQYKLALRYLHGKGTQKLVGEARELFERAAEQNYAPAQVQIGRFFDKGIIVQTNRVKAAAWFQKAAQQGDPEGLYLTGQCYEQGAGVPLYLPKALGFYLLASARGNREANERLGAVQEKMTEHQQQAGKGFAKEYSEQQGFNQGS